MTRKILALVLTLLMALAVALPVAADEVVELTLATSLYVEENHMITLDALLKAWNEKNPNIKITIYGANYDGFWDNLTTEIISGNEADIMQITPDYIAPYASLREGGSFLALDDYIAAEGVNYDELLIGQTDCKYDGKTVGLSNYSWGTTGIFYRKSILEACGIDPASIKTQLDFEAACRTAKEKGYIGMGVVCGTHTFTVSEFIRMFSHAVTGAYFKDEAEPYTAENIVINSPAMVDLVTWWQNLIKEGLFVTGPDKKDSRELFWNGMCAFNLDGPWFIGMTEAQDKALLEDTGVLPHVNMVYDGKEYSPRPTYSPYLMSVSSKCANPDAAWKFLSWMATDEAQRIAATCGMNPCNREYFETKEYEENFPLGFIMAQFINSYDILDMPKADQYTELQNIFVEAGQNMFGDNFADVKTELDEAYDRMVSVMNK